ncbi:eukaryotic translation initiation factor 4 gamma 3 isoform X2 [Drosophila ananassae]|uniref:eukaryotic translation initiation factor 4 gamma 3 isoform X2 n=1 Tax=Drosophila ananassae TaxID=7217 RepID=UPI0013A5C6D4|nr:eukaryotic translation initiation factor 4 gamma 3 isoform X2 [Drosophila ananassae]
MQQALPNISTQKDIAVMQPHSTQNMYVSTGNNSSGNTRTNPQSSAIFRGPPPSSNAPRGSNGSGTRHVHVQPMYSQSIHQNMVLQPYTQYNPRQQSFSTSHMQYAPPLPYYQYQYVPTLQQQPPPHSRSAVTVNANVNVANTLQTVQSVQNGPLSGPGPTSSQLQLLTSSVQAGANTVIGVGGPGNGMGQVGVAPMVGVIPTAVPSQAVSVQPSRRRHQHRLQIIDPATKKNILDDLDKTTTTPENADFSEQTITTSATAAPLDSTISIPPQDAIGTNVECNVALQSSDSRMAAPYITLDPSIRQDVGNTPVVSAMSDAPSVEIYSMPQKNRNKKNHIASTKNVLEYSDTPLSSELDDECKRENNQQAVTQENISSINIQSQSISNTQINVQMATVPEKEKVEETSSVSDVIADLQHTDDNTSLPESENIRIDEAAPVIPTEVLYHTKPEMLETQLHSVSNSNQIHDQPKQKTVPSETDKSSVAVKEEKLDSVKPIPSKDISSVSLDLQKSSIETQSQDALVDGPQNLSKSEDKDEAQNKNDSKDHDLSVKNEPPDNLPFINYNEGQWSPNNPSGKKQYDRDQLLLLREAKASRIQPEVKNVSILPQPNLMPSFIRNNNNNKRVQSMVGLIGNRSETGGNYIGKQVSMSGVQASGGRSSMKGMIHVNLSLNQDVKLNETENAWRPRVLNKSEADNNLKEIQEKEELVRRVRGILNKLTPERFDTLVEEIIKLKIDTPDKMDEVIVLVFEKAIDEPNFSVSYARLCHRLITEVKARDERMESGTKSNLQHFRNALLDKTEREFTQNVSQSTAKEKKLQPIVDKIKKCKDGNEKAELEALLEEEERKIRRRSGGTVRFIGELFKISMLTGKIIYSCIDTLLNPHCEDMLECLCKLLTTVGSKFEQTPVNSKDPTRCYSLEKSICRMQAIASKTDKDGAKVSSRVRFMLQDVIDLRKNKWQSTRNEAPKTMGQIEKEAKNEQLSVQYFGSLSGSTPIVSHAGPTKREDRGNPRFADSRSGGGYAGSHSQRGDNGNLRHQQQNNDVNRSGAGGSGHSNGNNDDNTWHVQTSKGSRSQAVDSNKLEGLSKLSDQNLETKKMGGLTQFIWNNSTSRQSSAPTSTPTNPFAVLSSLIDKNNTDRERDRERSGPRNKGSYNKGSIERDRYDRGITSRTGSSQGSRENSSSRSGQQVRSLINTSVQKSSSQTKYPQQPPPLRQAGKAQSSLGGSNTSSTGIQRGTEQVSIVGAPITVAQGRSKAPVAVFTDASETDIKLIKSVVSEMIELAAASKAVTPSVIACIKHIPEGLRCSFLYYILTDYLHLANVGKQYRRYLAITVVLLIKQNYISVDHFRLAYSEFSEFANDLIVDIPELWLYILEFVGPLLVKNVLTVSDLWNKKLKDNSHSTVAKKFLKTYLSYCTQEVGPTFTRTMWVKFKMQWSDFMPETDVHDFIESNRFEYVENEMKSPVFDLRECPEKHVKNVIEHIEHLLKEGTTADSIIDFSNGNIMVVDKLFIRGLTEILSNFSIIYKDNSYKLESETFQKFCIPVLQRYIDSNEDHQLECLYAMQLLVHSLEHPRGLLGELIGELYDGYVIQKESLYKWRDSKDQSAGKGVAVKSLNPFFNSLINDEGN